MKTVFLKLSLYLLLKVNFNSSVGLFWKVRKILHFKFVFLFTKGITLNPAKKYAIGMSNESIFQMWNVKIFEFLLVVETLCSNFYSSIIWINSYWKHVPCVLVI